MSIFVDRLTEYGSAPAIIAADGQEISYSALSELVDAQCERMHSHGRLIVIEAENELEPVVAYLAALRSRNPVMLIAAGRDDLRASILSNYRPESIFSKGEAGWQLRSFGGEEAPASHVDLAVMLSTSGSTGAAKFVRLSHANLDANARSIAEYLDIRPDDCAATTLPFHYCYGLSVINSHLLVGGRLLLTDASVVDDQFWEDCLTHGVTSFAGVPYTFELLDRVGFEDKHLSTLRTITQAGGRLPANQVRRYREMGERAGWQLFVMYGQTEATARMSYVPPDRLASHPESIGVPIPGGEFRLVDANGDEIVGSGIAGELVYSGPNVMMGYSERQDDLVGGPELTELKTGDIAERDEDGLYSIVGRTARFLKIFGLRISLDEVERKLADDGIRGVATGTDDTLVVATLDRGAGQSIRQQIAEWSRLPLAVVSVKELDDYPLLASGKVDYAGIIAMADAAAVDSTATRQDIRSIMREGTGVEEISPDSTFVKLGGDSLSYIGVSLRLEELLGYVPAGWENRTVAELEMLERRTGIWTQVETSIVLRAVAMVLIVCNHFDVFDAEIFTSLGIHYPRGSAMLLLVIAGINFGKFQLPRCLDEGARPILQSIWRVFLPTVIFLLTIELVSGKFNWSTILMYSNFVGPNVNFGIEPWFIYVLLQILCLWALLFSFPIIRRIASRSAYNFSLVMLAITTLAAIAGPHLWNTTYLFDRVPHIVMFAFVLGCCITLGQSTWQKLLHSALLVAYLSLNMIHYTWIVLCGGLVLVWANHILMVRPLNRLVGALGAASLFIYLSHHNFQQYARRLLETDSPLIDVMAGLLGGIVLWIVWEKSTMAAEDLYRRFRARYN